MGLQALEVNSGGCGPLPCIIHPLSQSDTEKLGTKKRLFDSVHAKRYTYCLAAENQLNLSVECDYLRRCTCSIRLAVLR